MKNRIVMINAGRHRPEGGEVRRPYKQEEAEQLANINTDPLKRMKYARALLISPGLGRTATGTGRTGKPYLATAVMAMQMVEDPGLGTLAVDSSWRLYYDPEEILEWEVDDLAAVIEHEIWHLLREHPARAQHQGIDESTHDNWNDAADCEIHSNEELLERVRNIPDSDPPCPEKYGLDPGHTVEYYYENIDFEEEQRRREREEQRRRGTGRGRGRSKRRERGRGRGTSRPVNPIRGKSGSSADGIKRPRELPLTNEIVNKAEEKNIRRITAENVKATADGKLPGIKPNDLELEWAKNQLAPPKVDWRNQLRSAVDRAIQFEAGKIEHSRRRMSRRQEFSPDFVLTGMAAPIPEIAVVVDTSGSMTAMLGDPRNEQGERYSTLLDAALHEVGGILEERGSSVGVHVLATDTAVHFVERVYDVRDIKPIGGGGTDMGVGLEAATRLEPSPNIIICLTDGYTDWPQHPPYTDAYFIVGIVGSTKQELQKTDAILKTDFATLPRWIEETIYIAEL